MIRLSNALPVQFWLAGEESFNQKEEIGVEHKCYYAPWLCSDTIPLQFTEDSDTEYFLDVIDIDGEIVETLPFVLSGSDFGEPIDVDEVQFDNPSFDTVMSPWTNFGSGAPFSWVPGNNVLAAEVSESDASIYQVTPSPMPIAQYVVRINASSGSPGGNIAISVVASNDGMVTPITIPSSSSILPNIFAPINIDITFTLDQEYSSLGFTFTCENPNIYLIVSSITVISAQQATGTLRDLSFIPNDISVCNQLVKLEIVDSEGNMYAFSDYLDIKTSHPLTRLVKYSNAVDFAGLDYSAGNIFSLRIESKFYTPRFPEEDESDTLSDGTVVKLSGSVKEQKQFITGDLPPYMHHKIKLILQHNTIYIDGEYWEKEESYEMTLPDEKYAFLVGAVFLTKKIDGFTTNVYGDITNI